VETNHGVACLVPGASCVDSRGVREQELYVLSLLCDDKNAAHECASSFFFHEETGCPESRTLTRPHRARPGGPMVFAQAMADATSCPHGARPGGGGARQKPTLVQKPSVHWGEPGGDVRKRD